MLDPKLIRNDIQLVAEQTKKRGIILNAERILALEEQRKSLQIKTQELQSERNSHAKKVGQAKAAGQDVTTLLKEVAHLGDSLKVTEEKLNLIQQELNSHLDLIPNFTHPSVPAGKSEADNQLVRIWGE